MESGPCGKGLDFRRARSCLLAIFSGQADPQDLEFASLGSAGVRKPLSGPEGLDSTPLLSGVYAEASSLTSCVTLGSHQFSQLLTAFFLDVTPRHLCVGSGVGVLENKVPGRVQQVLTLMLIWSRRCICIWFVFTRLCALIWEDTETC